MRQIVLDTETTGLEVNKGHRIIELACVELCERRPTGRRLHLYLNPDRAIDEGARAVHGISDEMLVGKPRFRDIVAEFLDFVRGAEVIAHNAAFDVGFLDAELALADPSLGRLADHAGVLDTLALAREKYPGQKNSLDALCKRLDVDNSHRDVHGALVDALLLADVYITMTAGQGDLGFATEVAETRAATPRGDVARIRRPLRVLVADADEIAAHERRLDAIDKASRGRCVWRPRPVMA